MNVSRAKLATLATVVLLFCAAPTVGDVGGCGTTATALDLAAFSAARKTVDCRRCNACGLTTARCARACDPNAPSDVVIPATCHPLTHDGEVCLDALLAARCSAVATFVSDEASLTPSECDFCLVGTGDGGGS